MRRRIIFCIVATLSVLANVYALPKTINPLDYGLEKAQNGCERYQVLLRCHQDAVTNGFSLSYKGIKHLEIEIPETGSSIPLPVYTDFCGVEMTVRTTGKAKFLFAMSRPAINVSLSGAEIDYGDFRHVSPLNAGEYLVIVEDGTPWVKTRKGYDYGATRKDVFYVKNGRSKERPACSYSTEVSKPQATYCKVTSEKKVVKNLNIVRDKKSPSKVFCLQINDQYKVELSNITITTSDDDKNYGDAAIQLLNCVDVTLNNITINGTYSQKNQYGYGINADNINKLTVNRMYARAKWGVFGTNNISNVKLKDCDINRFDIHCYGRDVKAVGCKFSGLYNQFSSVYGTVSFERCEFTDFIPVLIESSYNAYTPFDLLFKNCTFHLDNKHNYIMTLFGVPQAYNARPELNSKCLPNITMKNCNVYIDEGTSNWMLVKTDGLYYKEPFDYITEINIKGLKTIGNKQAMFNLFSEEVKTTEKLRVMMK